MNSALIWTNFLWILQFLKLEVVGWPLTVVLTPDAKPFFAGTYFPAQAEHGLPAFKDVLNETLNWYKENREHVNEHQMSALPKVEADAEDFHKVYFEMFDKENGGFGKGNKFPPHSTLLFLMAQYEASPNDELKGMITKTLDQMALRGLHDHLQGGFFRYCSDEKWSIPHFEKMLYDQAMHLWVYSVAYKHFGKELYSRTAHQLIDCLNDTFESDHLFFSGIDADTNHEEGATYLWTKEDLKGLEEFFEIPEDGNFEGKIHLIKKKEDQHEMELSLLDERKKREQPFVDKKILTSWNALLGIGLVMAYRYTDHVEAKGMADRLFAKLLSEHFKEGKLMHGSFEGSSIEGDFLEDWACVLLLMTYLYEDSFEGKELIQSFLDKVTSFFVEGQWMMSLGSEDFRGVPAQSFDHPIPSVVSLAEFAQYRAKLILEVTEQSPDPNYMRPLSSDFYNLYVFLKRGNGHDIHVPERIAWQELPVNVLQLPGQLHLDCHKKMCKMYKTKEELLKAVN